MHAWERFIEAEEAELGKETVNTWLKPLKILRFDACNLYLEAKDTFQAMWFEEHIRKKVQKKLLNNNGKGIRVHLLIANHVSVKNKKEIKQTKSKQQSTQPTFNLTFTELDPFCTFSNFEATKGNDLTKKICEQATGIGPQIPSSTFNPIYIYGVTGAGKSHLLMAMAHSYRQQGLKVCYVHAQTFTDHVVSAIRSGEMSLFRQTYRNSDVLLIDDIHIFSRKNTTQEEFFHTFNTLHIAGKQIVITSNTPPGELQFIEPRLISRFEWGIVTQVELPSREEALNILTIKSHALKFNIEPKIKDFLVDSFASMPSLIRSLEALILRYHLHSSSHKERNQLLSLATAKSLLSDLLVAEEKAAITSKEIIKCVAEHFGIKFEDILGKGQTRDCVLPRQIAMHLCRHQLKMPFVKIGDLFNKDHSTVMSSVKTIQKSLDTDIQEIAANYHVIAKKINSSRQAVSSLL